MRTFEWTPWKILLCVFAVIAIILPVILIGNIVEVLAAGDVMVIQSPMSGTLTWYTTPGLKWQWFGTVTKYKKRNQFWFSSSVNQGKPTDESLRIRFNDGASATISGSISWEMPSSPDFLTILHTKYNSQDGIEHQLIRTVMEKAVYMTGPLMSSTESYAERRNELLTHIEEQAIHGIYATETISKVVTDELTKQTRTKNIVVLKKGPDGKELHADRSQLAEYGVRVANLSINSIKYEEIVENQIKEQQKQLAAVQISITEARKAEQATITAEQSGKATAATAKWEQEKLNATQIALAEQLKTVAELNAGREKNVAETKANQVKLVAQLAKDAAEYTKQEQILLGEGESERRKLVLAADNALETKLKAYVQVAEVTARALAEYKGNWVPTIVLGSSASSDGQTSGMASVQEMLQLFLVRTAKDLALDLSPASAMKR